MSSCVSLLFQRGRGREEKRGSWGMAGIQFSTLLPTSRGCPTGVRITKCPCITKRLFHFSGPCTSRGACSKPILTGHQCLTMRQILKLNLGQ